MRKCFDRETTTLQILTELRVFGLPENEEVVFGISDICLGVCTSLTPEWLDGLYSYPTFKNLSVIGRCQVNMNILYLKIGDFQMGPPKKLNDGFSKTGLMVVITF
jgi:hypothetical protein